MIEFLLGNHEIVTAFVPLLLIRNNSCIESIIKSSVDSAFRKRVAANMPHLPGSETPFVICYVRDLRCGICSGEHQVPHLANKRKPFWVFNDDSTSLIVFSIEIAQWSHIRHPALLNAALHATHRVLTKIKNELIRYTALHAQDEGIIVWPVFSINCPNRMDDALLEHPLERPAINRVPGKAVNLPAKNSFRFAFLDTFEHLRK
ncbi:MAG: hypothetical protein AAB473_02240 [Patescibacteria group bacterium]